MAHGGNYLLSKGFKVLSTYNASATLGVLAFRAVKIASDTIDLVAASTDRTLGVVQENVDQAKVSTGKVVAHVALMGITKMKVGAVPGSIVQGGLVKADADGEVIAVGTGVGHIPIGVSLTTGTPAAGDLIDVLLTPGLPALTA